MGHPVGPVESKPLLHLTVEQALAMNQEATAFSGGSSHWSKPLY
jgi:hypothetical protein